MSVVAAPLASTHGATTVPSTTTNVPVIAEAVVSGVAALATIYSELKKSAVPPTAATRRTEVSEVTATVSSTTEAVPAVAPTHAAEVELLSVVPVITSTTTANVSAVIASMPSAASRITTAEADSEVAPRTSVSPNTKVSSRSAAEVVPLMVSTHTTPSEVAATDSITAEKVSAAAIQSSTEAVSVRALGSGSMPVEAAKTFDKYSKYSHCNASIDN